MAGNKREEFTAELARLKQARKRTTSRYLKTDYGKAIRRMTRELAEYDHHQQEAKKWI